MGFCVTSCFTGGDSSKSRRISVVGLGCFGVGKSFTRQNDARVCKRLFAVELRDQQGLPVPKTSHCVAGVWAFGVASHELGFYGELCALAESPVIEPVRSLATRAAIPTGIPILVSRDSNKSESSPVVINALATSLARSTSC